MSNSSTKCMMCGYDPERATSRERVEMNHFVNEKNPNDKCIINSNADKITAKDGTVYMRVGATKSNVAPSTPAVVPTAKTDGPVVPVTKTPIIGIAPAK